MSRKILDTVNQTIFMRIHIILIFLLLLSCAPESPEEPQGPMPRFSPLPDTAEILFFSDRSGKREIWCMDRDGNHQQRISNTDEYHFLVGMDKSKRYLIDSRADADTHPPQGIDGGDRLAIWVIDMQTMEERRLTDPKVHSEGDSFSPDAEWIVFLRRAEEGEQLDIYKIRRDGTELTQLTDTEYKTEGDPAWSNDETRIVFTEIDGLSEDPRFVLKTMNPDGGDVKILYDGGPGVPVPGVWPPGNYDPSWSPDDEWIVFERAVQVNQEDPENFGSGHWHIFKVRADGSQVVDLSLLGGHTDRAEYLPSFSPDGALIVYGSIYEAPNIEDSHGDIFVMDAEAGVAKRLTYSPYADMGPVFIGR